MTHRVKGRLLRTANIGSPDRYLITNYIDLSELPALDYFSTWSCLDCGANGEVKERGFKSTLRQRVRAHLICRCPDRVLELNRMWELSINE